jgi:hypothetical protein
MRRQVVAAQAIGAIGSGGCAQNLGIEDPVGDQCSPFDVETCDLSDTCDVDPTPDDPDHPILTCRPEGDRPAGAICDGAPSSCAGALSCIAGVCRTLCDDEHGCDLTEESGCLIDLTATADACDSDCNVLDGTGCSNDAEQQCMAAPVNGFVALCVPTGYFGNAAPGASCTFFEACVPGYGCDLPPNGDPGVCVPLCDVDSPACATGVCNQVGRLHETLALGLCSSG